MKQLHITKASGEKVAFDTERLSSSLKRAGADENAFRTITQDVVHSLYEGIPTKCINKKAFQQIKQINHAAVVKYKLKKAIMQLGPSGFPF